MHFHKAFCKNPTTQLSDLKERLDWKNAELPDGGDPYIRQVIYRGVKGKACWWAGGGMGMALTPLKHAWIITVNPTRGETVWISESDKAKKPGDIAKALSF